MNLFTWWKYQLRFIKEESETKLFTPGILSLALVREEVPFVR